MAIKPVLDHLEMVQKAFGKQAPTFEQWHQSRTLLDKSISWNATQNSPSVGAMKQLRGIMEDELGVAAETASERAGSAVASEYKAAKELFPVMRQAKEMLESKAARQEYSNRKFGAMDAAGSLIGGVVGGIPGMLLGGAVSHIARTRGDFIAADMVHRASKLSALSSTAAGVDARLLSGVKGVLGAAGGGKASPIMPVAKEAIKRGAPAIAGETFGKRQETYKTRARQVAEFQSNPTFAAKTIETRLGDMPQYAPKTAAAVADTVVRGNSYLFSKLPPPRIDVNSLTPHLQEEMRISPTELSKFARAAKAVDDPVSVLESAKRGILTRDEVDAVKTVYPKLYERMRSEVYAHVINAQSEIPYKTEVQLGTLLDIPTNRTMTGPFLQLMGDMYPAGDDEATADGGGGPAHAQVGKVEVAGQFGSAGNAIEKGAGT